MDIISLRWQENYRKNVVVAMAGYFNCVVIIIRIIPPRKSVPIRDDNVKHIPLHYRFDAAYRLCETAVLGFKILQIPNIFNTEWSALV